MSTKDRRVRGHRVIGILCLIKFHTFSISEDAIFMSTSSVTDFCKLESAIFMSTSSVTESDPISDSLKEAISMDYVVGKVCVEEVVGIEDIEESILCTCKLVSAPSLVSGHFG